MLMAEKNIFNSQPTWWSDRQNCSEWRNDWREELRINFALRTDIYMEVNAVLHQTQLTCKPTISPILISCGHQPCSTWVCRTPALCCITARPLSPYMFQAHSAASRDFQTATLITRSGMLFLLCWQHCNQ